jgi:hypothetical protein
MNSKAKEAMKALRANSIAYCKNSEGHIQATISNEIDYIWQVREIECLTSKLAGSTEDLFAVKTRKPFNRAYVHQNKLGKQFVTCLGFDTNEIRKHFPSHQLNPHVELYERHVSDPRLEEIGRLINHPVGNEDLNKWCDILNGCAKSIQEEAKSPLFKKAVNDFHHTANKNYRELHKYISDLLAIYTKRPLKVSRYDFGYNKDPSWPDVETVVRYADAKKHWEKMMKSLNKDLPTECLAGYAWRLTSSRDNSFNFHLVTFTDKSKVPEDTSIERIVFDQWDKVTDGKGLAYNCRSFKAGIKNVYNEEFKSCGIGMSNNSTVREGLDLVAFFMTQPDFHIRFVTPDEGRTFGKGVLPKPTVSEQAVEGTTSSKTSESARASENVTALLTQIDEPI